MTEEPDEVEHLREIVSNGLWGQVYRADQAYSLHRVISRHADEINESGFGAFFGSLQPILTDHFVISMTKIFEAPNKRFDIRSIPAALELLAEAPERLPIRDSLMIHERVRDLPGVPEFDRGVADEELTSLVARSFEHAFLHAGERSDKELRDVRRALRTLRNKAIAHDEIVDLTQLDTASWNAAQDLLDYAKLFVGIVGLRISESHMLQTMGIMLAPKTLR